MSPNNMKLSTHTKNALYGYICGWYDTGCLKTTEVWHLMDKDLVSANKEDLQNDQQPQNRHPVSHYFLTDLGIEMAKKYFPNEPLKPI